MTCSVLIDDSLAGAALLFEAPNAVISAEDPADVAEALSEMGRALERGAHLVGFFSYELGYAFEPKLQPLLPAKRSVPLLWFGAFDAPLALFKDSIDAHLRADGAGGYQLTDVRHSMDREAYAERFARVKDYIAAGDAYQLNLTFKAKFGFEGRPADLFADLRAAQPVSHGAFIQTPQFSILSASPELFFSRQGNRIATRPMKGTAARGGSEGADNANRAWLRTDTKSRAENLMIVDLMRNDFGRVAKIGSVTVSDLFSVETYPTLHQMTSGIKADLRDDVGMAELVASIFPPGSITGAPKLRAIEILRELETEPRGVYTGAIGVFSPDGEAKLNVAIRTLVIDADGHGEVGIGSGIVQDSIVRDEYDECLLKLRFLQDAVEPFELIETMRWDPGEGHYLLERHLQRLSGSAVHFGFTFDREAIVAALDRQAQGFGEAHQRVRVLLGRDGRTTLSAVAIDAPTDPAAMSYVFSEHKVESGNVFLLHKTTRRALYDGEHAKLSAARGCDEVVFLNERGELTEGSRTNIFIERDGKLLTPAIECGLLPGTLRAELIERGEAIEAVLVPGDLERADGVYLGNSVRGLVAAHELQIAGQRAANSA